MKDPIKLLILAVLISHISTYDVENSAEIRPYNFQSRRYREGKVVGGSKVSIEQVPWQIAIFFLYAYNPICGGSILSHLFVLTAAHCIQWKRPSTIEVRYGTDYIHRGKKGTFVKVKSVHCHLKYKPFVHDIGIIRVKTPIAFSTVAKPVVLLKDAPTGGEKATVTGWGKISSKKEERRKSLLKVFVTIVNSAICRKQYERTPGPIQVEKGMICAGGVAKGVCQGDSGGALIIKKIQVGIVSWSEGCAEPDFPAVYTSVSHYKNYIDMITLNTTTWA